MAWWAFGSARLALADARREHARMREQWAAEVGQLRVKVRESEAENGRLRAMLDALPERWSGAAHSYHQLRADLDQALRAGGFRGEEKG